MSSSPKLLVILAIVASVLMGLFTVMFMGFLGNKMALIFALPFVFITLLLFIFDRYHLFMIIILLRPSLDPILDKTKMGGFGVGGILNALVIIIAFIAICQKTYQLKAFVIKAWMPLLSILLVAVCRAPEIIPAIKIYLSLFSNAAIFSMAISLVKTQADYGYWMRVVLFSSLIPVFYGFVDFAIGGMINPLAGKRVLSTFSHPNILAFYLMLIIVLSSYLIKSKITYISPAFKKLLALYIIMMIVLLLFTKTRSAWVACFVYFALYAVLYERKYLIAVAAAPFIALAIPDIRDRILDLTQGNEVVTYGTLNSYAWRMYIWESGLNWMQPSHYLFGYGLEAFMHFSQDFFPLAGGMQRGAHNVYVQLFFDTGLVGLICFIWLYGSLAFSLAKFYKANKLMIFSAVMLICQYALIAYSDNLLSYLAFNWYFWFVLGAIYAISYRENELIGVKVSDINKHLLTKPAYTFLN